MVMLDIHFDSTTARLLFCFLFVIHIVYQSADRIDSLA